jgi:anti-sigma factor RsiW
MKTEELDHLIHHCLEGCLSESEAARLSALLEQSAEARERYWATASVHGLLEDSLQQASLRVISGQETRAQNPVVRWFPWRPLTAAAAGIVFGILSASMVWAYAVPLAERLTHESFPAFTDRLEEAARSPVRGFPRQANVWTGELFASPDRGEGMIRLKPNAARRLGYVWRIIDLAEQDFPVSGKSCSLEVLASFAAPDLAPESRYQIRLAAFSEAPAEVRAIWNNEPLLFDSVLQHIGRNVHTAAGDTAWHEVRATLEIPPGTRSLVICLGAGHSDPARHTQGHYLDAVHARFVVQESPLN